MITDAQILTIARELYAAEQAMKDAKAAKDEATRKADAAATLVTERTASVQRLRAKLLELAAMRPAEPAPRPESKPLEVAPDFKRIEEPPRAAPPVTVSKTPVPTLNAKRK